MNLHTQNCQNVWMYMVARPPMNPNRLDTTTAGILPYLSPSQPNIKPPRMEPPKNILCASDTLYASSQTWKIEVYIDVFIIVITSTWGKFINRKRERERGLPIQIRRRQKCKARRMGSFWSTIRGISSSAILDRALLPLSLFSRVYRISSIENKVNRVPRKVPNSRLVSYSPLIPRRWSPQLLVSRTKTRPERRWGTIVWNRRRWGRSRTPWAWRKGIFGTSRIRLI